MSDTPEGQYQLVYGDAGKMDVLRNREVDLILTSPPYFSDETEGVLRRAAKAQKFADLPELRAEITGFALSLRPVFEEMARVLKSDGVCVLQTRDIRYAQILIPLAGMHRELAESVGLNLFGRVFWHKMSKRAPSHKFKHNPVPGAFRTDQMEEILFFCGEGLPRVGDQPVSQDMDEIAKLCNPVWHLSSGGGNKRHPYQSPRELCRRIITLFTVPGDLVVDPFAGSATTLEVAVELDRRAVGYEISEQWVFKAERLLEKKLFGQETGGRP